RSGGSSVNGPPLLAATNVQKWFPIPRSFQEFVQSDPGRGIHAVDGVSFTINSGETLGLIGESGSGKTTIGAVVARLHEPTSGTIEFEGKDITHLRGRALLRWRRNVQVVFQDPVGSLDPRLRVWQIVGEPLKAQGRVAPRK